MIDDEKTFLLYIGQYIEMGMFIKCELYRKRFSLMVLFRPAGFVVTAFPPYLKELFQAYILDAEEMLI